MGYDLAVSIFAKNCKTLRQHSSLLAQMLKRWWTVCWHQGCGSGNSWLFEEPEAEAYFIKHGAGKRKRLNVCGRRSRSTLKKEVGSGSKLGSD